MVPVINGCIPIINCNADLILSISANVTRSRIFRLERSGGCARYVARAFRSIVSPSRIHAIVYVTMRSPIAESIGNRVVYKVPWAFTELRVSQTPRVSKRARHIPDILLRGRKSCRPSRDSFSIVPASFFLPRNRVFRLEQDSAGGVRIYRL